MINRARKGDDAVAASCLVVSRAVLNAEGVLTAARTDLRIGARQDKFRVVRDGQHRSLEHPIGVRLALQLTARQQAQLMGGLRQHDRRRRHRTIGVQLGTHAGHQGERPGITGIARGLAIADLEAAIGTQPRLQGIKIVPSRARIRSRQRLARIGAFHGDANGLAGRVHHHAGLDGIKQALNGAHTLQADIHAGIACIRENYAQGRPRAALVAQILQIALGRQAAKARRVHLAAVALHRDGKILDAGEGRDQHLPARAGKGQFAIAQTQIIIARGDQNPVLAGRTDHIAGVGIADDKGVVRARMGVYRHHALEGRGVDPISVFAAQDLGGRDVAVVRTAARARVTLNPAVPAAHAATISQRQPARPLTGEQGCAQRLVCRPGQTVGQHHQLRAGPCPATSGDVIAATQQNDLMPAARAAAGLDHPGCHQAADQHRIALKSRGIDCAGIQTAIELGIRETAIQTVRQHRRNRHRAAIARINRRQRRLAQLEIPVALFREGIAFGRRLRPELVIALVARKDVVAQTAAQDVVACAANQRQVAAIARAV